MHANRKKVFAVLTALFIFIVGVIGGYFLHPLRNGSNTSSIVAKQYDYTLLAKRIQVDNPNDIVINFTNLRSQLTQYIDTQTYSDSISLYFEYLPSGTSINVNEKNESIAASLMKLPVVMNLYKAAELKLLDLDVSIPLEEKWINNEFGSLYQKGAGYEISLREAARLTLSDSDNTALLMIWDQVQRAGLPAERDSLNALDIEFSIVEDGRALIGARSYSSILKCLYFACNNTKDHSQEILTYLSQSTFDNRLTSLLPADVEVAHKVGSFSERYQSDCGIFYLSNRQYILCVMVEGEDPGASTAIAEISDIVYRYVVSK